MTVSVIITTYHRVKLLMETLNSMCCQTILPNEILIGDDSKDDETEQHLHKEIIPNSSVPIKYFHHKPSLKEAKNVDFLYEHASGDLILHLHDDDPVFPRCIELLKKPFEEHPEIAASFGLQKMIDDNGSLLQNADSVNKVYFRVPEKAGLVNGFMAGAVSMFPNNGFMIRKEAAIAVGYYGNGRAGLASDFYFGFRLGQLGMPFYFVNEFTAFCRITSNSLSRTNQSDNAYQTVKIIIEDCKPEQIGPEIKQSLKDRIPLAITIAARKKDKRNAFKWLFSKYYRKRLFTPRGLKRIFLALKP